MKLDELRARMRVHEDEPRPHPGLTCMCGKLATKRLRVAMHVPVAFACDCGATVVEGPVAPDGSETVYFAPGIALSAGEDGRLKIGIEYGHECCMACQSEVHVVWAEDQPRFELECPSCSGANLIDELLNYKKTGK